ncbi:bifunctional protein-serine/threonine kinase/phosphatase [Acidocella sp.]|uniref:bifunctional protein-serine/threonine kinase/phosphatase n=1 Tax=Acidocella sp. TaxID=50710 RepID=UPI00260F8A24|nr:bifunctional serine/threonine-protein phosphatase/kinase [Acidocella sp.]
MAAETPGAAPLCAGAWSLALGFASTQGAEVSRNFYAVYEGAPFGAAERGLLAVMARGHGLEGTGGLAGRDSAQSAVHGFAEGYFGAPRTLSGRRASSLSLASVNRWLAGHMQGDASRHLAPVSLSGVVLQHREVGLVQIGACQLYRVRGGVVTPLMRAHVRPAQTMPARALGLDQDVTVDHAEELAEAGDVLVLLAGVEDWLPEAVYAALDAVPDAGQPVERLAKQVLAALTLPAGADVSVMALRILTLPAPNETRAIAALKELPLRPPPREGDVWDGFEIGETLFRGRYTLLKKAFDTEGQRVVAMKIPLPAMLQDEVFSAGFMREAWIGGAVRSSVVVHYIDIPIERRSSLYLVMPYYEGETLERRLNRGPLVSLPEGVGIALKLCEAVQDLAAIQVIHRDIKPENVMLLKARGEVRLLDLGLAYLPGIDVADATKTGGTIRYMAPELLKGAPVSGRSEVYALGVTLYRVFAGGPFPFGQREKLPLARLRPDLPSWLGEVLKRALAPEPERRFANAGELAKALQIGLTEGAEPMPRPTLWLGLRDARLWQVICFLLVALSLYLWVRGGR